MRAIIAAAFGVAVLSAGCGGKSTPAAPTPTVQSVTVTSATDLVFIGASEPFAASVSMSDGSSRSASGGAWGTDAPGVAAVEAGTGRVTGIASGTATIYFEVQGSRGTKTIRVLPNFQGTWSGSYIIRGCSHTGDLSRINFCGNFDTNRVLPTNFNITQDRDRVQGRFFLGTLGGDGSGPVQSDGRLLFTGAIREAAATIEVTWGLESAAPGRITGTLALLWRATGLSGDGRVNADIRDLNRTSTISAPAPLAPSPAAATLMDLFGMVEGRR